MMKKHQALVGLDLTTFSVLGHVLATRPPPRDSDWKMLTTVAQGLKQCLLQNLSHKRKAFAQGQLE